MSEASVIDIRDDGERIAVILECDDPEQIRSGPAYKFAQAAAKQANFGTLGVTGQSGLYAVDKDGKTQEDGMPPLAKVAGYRNDIFLHKGLP